MLKKTHFWIILTLSLVVLGSGCIPKQDFRVAQENPDQVIAGTNTIGQTFLARHDGLSGVEIFLAPKTKGDGILELSVFDIADADSAIVKASLPLDTVAQSGYYLFSFRPVDASFAHTYYFEISISDGGAVYSASGDPSSYLDGGMYFNGSPNNRQLKFSVRYQPMLQIVGILRQFGSWVLESTLAALLFLLPGLSLLILVGKHLHQLSLGEKLGLAGGLSASLLPTLYSFAYWFGISPGQWLTWGVFLLSGLVVIWWVINSIRYKSFLESKKSSIWIPDLTLIIVLCMVSFTRFWAIRTLQAPIGLDPIHHTAIIQLILNNDGLFQSWLPYAPYQTFTTHFGFHLLTAAYIWVSNLESLHAILISAQTINLLSVLAVYPLALRFSNNNRWAGVGAVLTVGLLTPVPAFFLNWGRYPQLVGQLILPATCWLFLQLLDTQKGRLSTILLGGLTLAGITYSYYRLPYYFIAFALAWLIVRGYLLFKNGYQKLAGTFSAILAMGVIAILLFSPWISHLLGGRLGTEETHGTINTMEQVIADYQVWKTILSYASIFLLVGAGFGLITGLIRRIWDRLALVLWVVILASFVAAALLNIPGLGLMQNNAILMAVYIPLGILFGGFIADVNLWLSGRKLFSGRIFSLILIVIGALGIPNVARITAPSDHTFITTPDLRAMHWIRENTSKESRFFIPVQRFKQTSAIAFDAGWWIPILTERQNNLPPQYALVMEKPYQEGYNELVVQWAFDLEKFSLSDPQGLALLCENGFEYIYFGQYGRYWYPSAKEIYLQNQQGISNSPYFSLEYQEDQVKIYKLTKEICLDSQ